MILEEQVVFVAINYVALEHFSPKIDILEVYAELRGILYELYLFPVDDCRFSGVFPLLASFLLTFLFILDGGSEYLVDLDFGYLRLLI